MAVYAAMATDCVDLDGDGYPSSQCGGTDCDDTNPAVHPGQAEICNGIDDNCSGMIDEGANICPTGEVCVAPDGGTPGCEPIPDSGGATGEHPDFLDFGGGCEVPSAESAPVAGVGALGLALALIGARARRRRR
jgi:hypothetical protein